MKNLSAIIITRNESADIGRCLESLSGLAAEIVLVDDFSDDGTAEKAAGLGARVLKRKFDSYGGQKQFALDNASHEWVLNIDADEAVSEGLRAEIEEVLASPSSCSGFEIPFRVHFLGRLLRHGSSAGEKHLRLFRKDRSGYSVKAVHEKLAVEGGIGGLKEHIDHYSYADLSEYFEKFNRYTSLIAAEKFRKGARFRVYHLARLPLEFVSRYFIKLGFLDGWNGFLYAFLASFYSVVKYLKLWDLQRKGRAARG